MICRPDKRLLAAVLALLALPALAAGGDPLGDAAAAIERGDGVSAEGAARRALEAGLPRETVAADLGAALVMQGRLDEARRWLGSGGFAAESAGRGFHALGLLQLEEGDFGGAAHAFDRALAHGPATARLWVDIARLRYLSGEQHLAAGAVSRALALDPGDPRAMAFEAGLIRDSQGLAAALDSYERAVERVPGDLDLLGDYAATLGEYGRYRDMLRIARRMVEIDRRHPRAYYLQAVLAARAGQTGLARRLLSRTNDAYAEAPATMLLEGVLEYRSGNPALAAGKFAELARRQPDNAMAARLHGRALLASGEASEVIARFATRAQQPDVAPYVLTLVGRAYEQLGRRDLAAPYLDRASLAPDRAIAPLRPTEEGELAVYRWGDDPLRAEVAVTLLRTMLSEGRTAEAAAHAGRLRARFPGSADIEVLVGDVALLAGDPASARSLYRSAAEVRQTAALAERMAAAERALGRDEEGEAVLVRYLAHHPRDRDTAAQLGRRAMAGGEWRRAALLLGHAAELPGGSGDVLLLADLAEARLRADEAPAALGPAERAYRLQRSSPRATRILAVALAATGRAGDSSAQVLLAKARRMEGAAALARR